MEYFIIWLLFGMAASVIANNKGRSGCSWFLLGMLLGPFSLIILALPSLKPGQEQPTPETHVQCPDCAELIKKEARVCKHCGCRVVPQGDDTSDQCKDKSCTGILIRGYCNKCGKSDQWKG